MRDWKFVLKKFTLLTSYNPPSPLLSRLASPKELQCLNMGQLSPTYFCVFHPYLTFCHFLFFLSPISILLLSKANFQPFKTDRLVGHRENLRVARDTLVAWSPSRSTVSWTGNKRQVLLLFLFSLWITIPNDKLDLNLFFDLLDSGVSPTTI